MLIGICKLPNYDAMQKLGVTNEVGDTTLISAIWSNTTKCIHLRHLVRDDDKILA